MAGYYMSKGDSFWTFSGGLGGIIAASAGNDLYHPLQAFLIGIVGVWVAYKLHYWVERKFKIDDAVGAVAVHGYAGSFGVIICGSCYGATQHWLMVLLRSPLGDRSVAQS